MKRIILASASLQRRALLAQLGLSFDVIPSHAAENIDSSLAPAELAKSLSCRKARAVSAGNKNALIIAADTFIVFHGKILGKPFSAAEARSMLESLNGKTHTVITGFTIIDTDSGRELSRSVATKVSLKTLTPEQIAHYVEFGEPLDKAGAYAIQGLGAALVEKIVGDHSNVVGLPLSALADSLQEFGISVL